MQKATLFYADWWWWTDDERFVTFLNVFFLIFFPQFQRILFFLWRFHIYDLNCTSDDDVLRLSVLCSLQLTALTMNMKTW